MKQDNVLLPKLYQPRDIYGIWIHMGYRDAFAPEWIFYTHSQNYQESAKINVIWDVNQYLSTAFLGKNKSFFCGRCNGVSHCPQEVSNSKIFSYILKYFMIAHMCLATNMVDIFYHIFLKKKKLTQKERKKNWSERRMIIGRYTMSHTFKMF